jgi:hypothetical protein
VFDKNRRGTLFLYFGRVRFSVSSRRCLFYPRNLAFMQRILSLRRMP